MNENTTTEAVERTEPQVYYGKAYTRRLRLWRFWNSLLGIYLAVSDAVNSIVTTIVTLALVATIYITFWPVLFDWATFVTASIYLILLSLRLLHHSDLTMNELGERIEEINEEINEKLDRIERNQ